MRIVLLLLSLLLFIPAKNVKGQSSSTTLDVVSWNVEWFGASFEDPADDNLQRENVKKIIRYLDADIYGLVEIVDTAQLSRLMDSLGANYGYALSDYCSNASAPGTGAWRNGQKLCFIFKKDVVSNIKVRGMLRNSATANTNWATGRFPYLLNADVTINSITKNINFILIHGKSGSTAGDYNRRLAGAQELKDTLDAQYAAAINMIIGDFNDALNQTISTGSGPQTSYQPIVADSADSDHYKSITLPLAYAGQTTMINYPNVIDNHIISNELTPFYIPGSAQIRTDVTTVVPDFVTAGNTSDHYPVFAKYNLAGITTGVTDVSPGALEIQVYPNPFYDQLLVKTGKALNKVQLSVSDMTGRILRNEYHGIVPAGSILVPSLPSLSKGVYFLTILTDKYRTVIKLVHL